MIISALAWMSQYSASIHYSEFLTSALIAHLHFVNDNWLKRSNKKGETKLENSRLFNNSKENKQHRLLQRDRGCCLVEEGILNLWSMWQGSQATPAHLQQTRPDRKECPQTQQCEYTAFVHPLDCSPTVITETALGFKSSTVS